MVMFLDSYCIHVHVVMYIHVHVVCSCNAEGGQQGGCCPVSSLQLVWLILLSNQHAKQIWNRLLAVTGTK